MGHFKKTLNYSLEDNDQGNLNDILLSYIAEKEENREIEAENHQIQSNVLKSSDGNVYNIEGVKDPLIHKGKGRPPTKRIKAFNEENGKTGRSKTRKIDNDNSETGGISGRKCRICHETGHYAPKCPNKEN